MRKGMGGEWVRRCWARRRPEMPAPIIMMGSWEEAMIWFGLDRGWFVI